MASFKIWASFLITIVLNSIFVLSLPVTYFKVQFDCHLLHEVFPAVEEVI